MRSLCSVGRTVVPIALVAAGSARRGKGLDLSKQLIRPRREQEIIINSNRGVSVRSANYRNG
jgi:hypothetical protein